MKSLIIAILALVLGPYSIAIADDHHDHGPEESHADEKTAGEKDVHHENEEKPANVGPNKGVLDYDEHLGMKLSEQAQKNFGVVFHELKGSSPWELPSAAILYSQAEKNIYLLKNGFLKRVDIEVTKLSEKTVRVSSNDLKPGDTVAVQGVGFIRVAEADLTSGETGHHH